MGLGFLLSDSEVLERVAQCKLHYAAGLGFAKRILSRGEVTKTNWRRPTKNERVGVQTGTVESGKTLRVCQIEDFPTER